MREYKRQRLPFLPSRLLFFVLIALWAVFDYLFAEGMTCFMHGLSSRFGQDSGAAAAGVSGSRRETGARGELACDCILLYFLLVARSTLLRSTCTLAVTFAELFVFGKRRSRRPSCCSWLLPTVYNRLRRTSPVCLTPLTAAAPLITAGQRCQSGMSRPSRHMPSVTEPSALGLGLGLGLG